MNPQHSSSAQADLRWRDGLQAKSCTSYSIMHDKAFNESRLRQCSFPGVGYLFDRYDRWITGTQTDDPSCCRCGSRQFTPSHEQQIYNRMNGSPGDPPGNRMHKFKPKRIAPFIHRLAGDPTGKEAGWETNIGDTKHVNKHIN
jgi:hypothetical protein